MATIEALYKLQELELAIKKNKADLADIGARIERDEAASTPMRWPSAPRGPSPRWRPSRRGWTARCRIRSGG